MDITSKIKSHIFLFKNKKLVVGEGEIGKSNSHRQNENSDNQLNTQ